MTLPSRFDAIVIGGGASAVFVMLQLQRQLPEARVLWLSGRADGFGAAYRTLHPKHLLNVPVERMGAWPDQPQHFLDWLTASRASLRITPGSFVSRLLFAQYLQAQAASLGFARLARHVTMLNHVGSMWQVTDDQQTNYRTERVFLALGTESSAPVLGSQSGRISCWTWWQHYGRQIAAFRELKKLTLIGSGLSAVDMTQSFRECGFVGPIHVMSPSGRWPAAHAATDALPEDVTPSLITQLRACESAIQVVRLIRSYCTRYPWREVIDALRFDSNSIWQHFAFPMQAQLLRHALSHWARARHRMAPLIEQRLLADLEIHISCGRVQSLANDTAQEVPDALTLDCTGLGLKRRIASDPLLQQLLQAGYLSMNGHGRGVQSLQSETLALLGTLRFGDLFECTAVPELREQAFDEVQRLFALSSS